jgi:DNA-binding LacI/PurR family transcriptional regulator
VTVFSINSGYNTVDDIEFAKRPLLHIGQDEVSAGEDVAQTLYDAGKRHAACINDEASNTNKVARCTAFDAKFVALGGTVRVRTRPPSIHPCCPPLADSRDAFIRMLRATPSWPTSTRLTAPTRTLTPRSRPCLRPPPRPTWTSS